MNQQNQDAASLDALKDKFAIEWAAGEKPTLEKYIAESPEHASELIEFALNLVQLSSGMNKGDDHEPYDQALVRRAMDRGIAAGMSDAQTLAQRLEETHLTHVAFYEQLGVSEDFIAAFQRQPVSGVPQSFWHRASIALNDTLSRVQVFLSPRRLAFRSGQAPEIAPVEFSQLLDKVHAANGLSDDQFEFWRREVTGHE
jgi:hypothetical protein